MFTKKKLPTTYEDPSQRPPFDKYVYEEIGGKSLFDEYMRMIEKGVDDDVIREIVSKDAQE